MKWNTLALWKFKMHKVESAFLFSGWSRFKGTVIKYALYSFTLLSLCLCYKKTLHSVISLTYSIFYINYFCRSKSGFRELFMLMASYVKIWVIVAFTKSFLFFTPNIFAINYLLNWSVKFVHLKCLVHLVKLFFSKI